MSIFDLFDKIKKTDECEGKVEYLVVCLGNPGSEYRLTRHNAGFLCAEVMAKKHSFDIKKAKFRSIYADTSALGKRALVMLPQTYMNNSGEAVKAAADFYNIPVENIVVLVDDAVLDIGQIRVRRSGSHGGHNGLKDIIECLSSDKFPRVRIGVGKKPHPDYDIKDWVLGNLPSSLMKEFNESLEKATLATELIVCGKIDEAMNKFNSK